MRKTFAVSALLASSFSYASVADQSAIYIGANIGFADDQRGSISDANGFGFRAGVRHGVSSRLALELNASHLNYDDEASATELDQTTLGLDLNYLFLKSGRVIPFGILGAGIQRSEINSNEDVQNHYLDLGLGLFHQLNEYGLTFRADVRWRRDFFDVPTDGTEELDDVVASVGFGIPFGQKDTVQFIENSPNNTHELTHSSDQDKDGVPDTSDQCPNSDSVAAVDINGCSYAQNNSYEPALAQQNTANTTTTNTQPTTPPTYQTIPPLDDAFTVTFVGNTAEPDRSGSISIREVAQLLIHSRSLNATIWAGYVSDGVNLTEQRAQIIEEALWRYGVADHRINIQYRSTTSGISIELGE